MTAGQLTEIKRILLSKPIPDNSLSARWEGLVANQILIDCFATEFGIDIRNPTYKNKRILKDSVHHERAYPVPNYDRAYLIIRDIRDDNGKELRVVFLEKFGERVDLDFVFDQD